MLRQAEGFTTACLQPMETVAVCSPSSTQTDKQLEGAVGTKAPIELATIGLLFHSGDKDLQDWHNKGDKEMRPHSDATSSLSGQQSRR